MYIYIYIYIERFKINIVGIQGSGFALHVQQKEKQKMYHKQYPAAAQLIQTVWRMYATNRLQQENATWRLYRLVDPIFGLNIDFKYILNTMKS